MRQTRGLTLAELLAGILLLGIVVVLLVLGTRSARVRSRRERCRNNLIQLAKGMATYLNPYNGRWYPWPGGRAGCGGEYQKADFGGAEFLATLYWTKILPDPGVFICPGSGDANQDGQWLGDGGCAGPGFAGGPDGKLKPEAVSYAAMASTSVAVYEREKLGRSPFTNSPMRYFPANEPVACDDTEGTVNHGRAGSGGMCGLFFDSHVEPWTNTKVDLLRGVGQKGTALVALRNWHYTTGVRLHFGLDRNGWAHGCRPV